VVKLKYKPGDRVMFRSEYTNGERPYYDGTVLFVDPEDRWGRPYKIACDAYVWHGYISASEDRLIRLGGVDENALRWLRDRELVAELRLFNHKEAADRLDAFVGKFYDGTESPVDVDRLLEDVKERFGVSRDRDVDTGPEKA
jgi:hypothetical protein